MTNTEKVFAFGLPIAALVLSLFAILKPRPATPPTKSSPPVVVDITTTGASNCSATPQHPFMVLTDQNTAFFNATDNNPTTGTPVYWVEFNTNSCVNNPTDSGNNYRVPAAPGGGRPYGYSRPYTAASATETDITYIICNDSTATPPPKCSNGPGMDGLHIKPGP